MPDDRSKIEWTDYSLNFWLGCQKVSDGCANCYAEHEMDTRWGKASWGPLPRGTRTKTSPELWKKLKKWNDLAARSGRPLRVFVNPDADFFEDWLGPILNSDKRRMYLCTDEPDRYVPMPEGGLESLLPIERENFEAGLYRPATMQDLRNSAFSLFDKYQHLIFILVTKRPELIKGSWMFRPGDTVLPRRENVWLLTSVESQTWADKRVPEVISASRLASIVGLSCEPLLGPIDIAAEYMPSLGWVIAGGESGPNARPAHPAWVRSLRDRCLRGGVPFFFKQWGEYCPLDHLPQQRPLDVDYGEFHNRAADSWVDCCLCEEGTATCYRIGKKRAGHVLDGQVYQQLPLLQDAQS